MQKETLNYRIIKAATEGDENALDSIMKHFEGYMSAIARTKIYDDDGKEIRISKREIHDRLKEKLAFAVRKFDASRIV
jgi:hypothetical protein